MKITTRMEQKATKQRDSLEVVSVDDCEIGFVTKYRNTKTEKHPWKAFRGIGFSAKYLGAFYPEDGGKQSAIDAVIC